MKYLPSTSDIVSLSRGEEKKPPMDSVIAVGTATVGGLTMLALSMLKPSV